MIFKTYENLKTRVSDLHLMVWWEWKELQKFIPKYESDRNVKFLWSLDVHQILQNLSISTLFLFPSRVDSFWLVQLESMSSWNPVICFKKSENDEIVQNGINGFCVESENDFIEKTYEVLTNSSLRKKLSLWSRETSQRFTSKSFEKQLVNIFGF
jgi:glycosyltransferase involved in cell wall biosynthesis